MVLLHPVPDLYVSCDACEVGGEWGLGTQFSYVCLDDLTGHYLGMIV